MAQTQFVNPNGLTNENVSTASDLVKLVRAAISIRLIWQFTTDPHYDVRVSRYVLPPHFTPTAWWAARSGY